MSQRQYKRGNDRTQHFLLPPSVEEYVGPDNPVRAIDSYVESLNLAQLGFQYAAGPLTPGQPAYHPKVHLKLYLYGYLNRVRSSRRLEAECRRNLEVLWLLEGQQPSYKAIADFRKDNLTALKAVNRDFVQVCQELELYGAELVAIDGAMLRGNVAKDSIFTAERLQRSLAHIDADIQAYLAELEQADQHEADAPSTDPQLPDKLAQLRQRQQQRQAQVQQLQASGATQLAEVDADARLLSKPGQGTIAGYNVQIAVDAKHKLLVVAEAVQDGNDEQQLAPMGTAAKDTLAVEQLTTTQDAGYYNVQQIQDCEANGITPYVPEPDKHAQTRQQGRLPRAAFTYDAQTNAYTCPQGQLLKFSTPQSKGDKVLHLYRSSVPVCAQCPLQDACLPKKTPYRTLSRWEHEADLEAHRARMAAHGAEKMRQRAAICEHIFGTLKQWCGWTHFLLRGFAKVRAELSLLMLAYNFKRVLSILGQAAFRAYCSLRKLQMAPGRG